MATWYGQTPGDVIVGDSNADNIPDVLGIGATLTIWSLDQTTQITDLLDKNSNPVAAVTADDKGRVIFAQPADDAGSVWGKDADDNFWLFVPGDLAERLAEGVTIDDSALVHKTGAETIGGVKTFSSAPVVPNASFAIAKTSGLQVALDSKQDESAFPDDFAAQASTYLPDNNYQRMVFLDSDDPTTGLADGTFVFRRTTPGGETPAVNQIAVGGSTTDGTTFNTDSMSPTAGALHLAHVTTADADGAAALASASLTGAGLTWTRVADVSSTGTPNGVLHSALFVGTGTPTPGAVTIAPGATVESVSWRFIDVTNVATALVQAATAAPANGSTNPGVTLSEVSATNWVFGFIAQNNGNTITPGAGFTEIGAAQGSTTPSCFIAAQYKATGQNTVSWATTGTVQRTVIGIEVAPA